MWNQFSNASLSTLSLNSAFCHLYKYPMRPPSISTIFRTLTAVSNTTTRFLPQQQSAGLLASTPPQHLLRNTWMPLPSFSSLFTTKASSRDMSYPYQQDDTVWQTKLSSLQYNVLRNKDTEAPYVGKFDQHYPAKDSKDTYNCAGCANPLYTAQHKFKSGCGWPAFYDAIPGAITRHEDRTMGAIRTEIVCSNCGSHLGHVFKGEGYATPTDERHCVNSVSINFGDISGDKDQDKVKK